MQEVRAYIKPRKLGAVIHALHGIDGLTGLSVSDVRGFGRGRGTTEDDHIVEDLVTYNRKVRLEIFCHNELVEDVLEAITNAAHTGLRGDGKIYVIPVKDAIRISSRARGEEAV